MEYKDFFFQAAIYLLAAVLSVPLAKRLGLGSVLGYLIAGIIIGPYVLGVVGQSAEHVMHFAEFGVVMMLFLIGLELRPKMLWQLRAHIFGLGLMQVLVTTMVFAAVFMAIGFNFSAALVIGMILSMSSTAIVMQIFNEKGLLHSPVGQSTFSVLLFQDLAVIPIMAIMSLLPGATKEPIQTDFPFLANLNHWQHVLLIICVVVGLVLGARFLLRPLFRFVAAARLREVFTATALLLVIANALIMQAIGLSAALGTFLAGALLAESEYRHELEADVEPFKGLLLGVFFISVGANINFNLAIEAPYVVLMLVVLLITVKAMLLFGLAFYSKMNIQNSLLFALTLAQGGEFCFVLLSHAVNNHVLTLTHADQFIFAVTMSMLFTPLLLMCFEKKISPYFINKQEQQFDEIQHRQNSVIVAGFGRFGQIVSRLLMANKIKVTILDLDAAHIEIIRKFGFKVFYGDATRYDLLQSAGIEHAKLLIIAIDDSVKALELAQYVREKYPQVKILARVRGRTQAYDFLKLHFTDVYRETFDTSLRMGADALKVLGFSHSHAARSVQLFKEHDEETLRRMYKYLENEEEYIAEVKRSRKNLEKALSGDNTLDGQILVDHPEILIDETIPSED